MTRLEQALEALRGAATEYMEHHSGDVSYVRRLTLDDAIRILTERWPPESAPAPVDMEALTDVKAERARQDAKWGEQNHDPFTYLTVLIEEVGEFAQAALHTKYGGKAAPKLREEAVHTAAVALAIVECLDRAKWTWPDAAPAREVPPVDDEREGDLMVRMASSYKRHIEELTVALDAARAERDTLRKQTETTYCAYCGHATQIADKDEAGRQITEHIRTCPKHPMRAVEAELARLRERVAALLERLRFVDEMLVDPKVEMHSLNRAELAGIIRAAIAADDMHPALKDEEKPTEPDVVLDILSLVLEDDELPTLEQIDSWTPGQREEATDWASLEHLSAADNPVKRKARPSFLPGKTQAPKEAPHD